VYFDGSFSHGTAGIGISIEGDNGLRIYASIPVKAFDA
jgi:hypothetical protein